MNNQRLCFSKEATPLEVTLDDKLTRKPHLNHIFCKMTASIMQCRQLVGNLWPVKPPTMKFDIHSKGVSYHDICLGAKKYYLKRKRKNI